MSEAVFKDETRQLFRQKECKISKIQPPKHPAERLKTFFEELSKHLRIVEIKEASEDMSYIMKIAHCAGSGFALYSGNDDITIPLLSVGGSGVISAYANICPRLP